MMVFKKVSTAILLKRTSIGMTQDELAKKSKVSKNEIVAIESGKKKDARMSTLEKIAGALGIQLHELYKIAEEI